MYKFGDFNIYSYIHIISKNARKIQIPIPFPEKYIPHPFSFKESIYQINNYLLRIAF